MEDSSTEVHLQPAVEELIKKICLEKCLPPPNVSARRSLSTITEASAIEILNNIAVSSRIRTLSGYIIYMVKKLNSTAASSPNSVWLSPQKRSPPPSTAPSPQKSACYYSPSSKQFVHAPCSSSKSRTIPEYFPGSPNNGYGSSVSKQIPCSGLKDANPNNITCHLLESSNATHHVSSVQKQLIFSPCSSSKSANPRNITQHFSDPPHAIDHVSPVQKQLTFSAGCSFDGANPSMVRHHFPGSPNNGYGSSVSKQIPCSGLKDANPNNITCHLLESSNATHHVSSVQKQLIFSPCSSSKSANPRNITQHFSDPPHAIDHVSPVQKQLTFSAGCSFDGANPSMVRHHFFDPPNVGHHFSPVQQQHTFLWCSSSKGANPGNIASRFSDFPTAIHDSSLVQEQHTLSPCVSFGGATPANVTLGFGSMTPNLSESTSSLAISQQSLILAELEFRKLFMVHSYVGRKKLEDVVSIEDAIEIKLMKNASMFDFEANIWAKYGRTLCESCDRAMHFDWDSGKTCLYHCYVSADGSYRFKGPYLNTRRTHLQRVLGDDNVLVVQFIDDPETPDMPSNYCNWSAAYQRIAGGISIGLRHYRLFAFKDGKGDNKNAKVNNAKKQGSSWAVKCYFVRKESHAPWDERDPYILFNKTSHEARCLFMHVHMVSSMAKYISRCSLALSNTIKLRVDLASVVVERIEDVPCRDENGCVVCDEDGEPLIHTDGTGFISEDLAILCAKDFIEAKGTKDDSYEFIDLVKLGEESLGLKDKELCIREPPLLVQCRLFKEGYAVKGTLLVNKKLKSGTIQIRPSMIKVEKDSRLSDSNSFSSLEIVSISRRPRKANLSKNLITLLTVGGVPKEYFLGLLDATLQDAQKVSSSMRAAVRVGLSYGQMDDSATSVAMIGSGIPLDEPYLQYRLSILTNEERKGLRNGKIPVNESFYLIGTADPTGTLNNEEVCIILENGQISGKVLVYRNPGLHFGDIHVLNAKYVEALEEFVGNAKYGIFFSTKGKRSVGSEIANGDFDGDLYWVSRSPQLLHYFKVSEPWKRIHSTPSVPSKKPSQLSPEELENELFTLLFATQKQNMVAGKAADSWLTFMDQYLILGEVDADEKHRIKEKLLKLVDLYYDALDAPKSGKTVEIPKCLLPQKYPHFLEKNIEKTYNSTSVLGLIYDTAKAYRPDNSSIQEIWKLPCFNVEVPEASLNLWRDRYRSYRQEMSDALSAGDESKNDSAKIVLNKYKQMLYEAEDFLTSGRKMEDIHNEALAIYHVSYDHARSLADVKKCGFAWKVAGEALCSFHETKTPGRSIPFKLAVLSLFI